MNTTTISVEQYLATSYHPDVDYVDGQLEERNVGEKQHGKLMARVYFLLEQNALLKCFLETRLRVSASRYRVPDICAYTEEPDEEVFTLAPLLCVEILSPKDKLIDVMEVVQDYLRLGTPVVWLFDPIGKVAYMADLSTGLRQVAGTVYALDGQVVLELSDLF